MMTFSKELADHEFEDSDVNLQKLEEIVSSQTFTILGNGKTLLKEAVAKNDPNIVTNLLKAGAKANARYTFGRTLLHAAAINGYSEIAKLLILFGAIADAKDDNFATPLHEAVEHLNPELVKILLKAKANINARNDSWNTPLLILVDKNIESGQNDRRNEILALLIQFGADVHARDKNHNTALQKFLKNKVIQREVHVIETLLKSGAKVNVTDKSGRSLLHLVALKHCHCYFGGLIAKVLIQHGASVNLKDNAEETPLTVAVKNSNIQVLNVLLEAKADAFIKSKDGRTLLHYVGVDYLKNFCECTCDYGCEVTNALVTFGLDANAKDTDGNTALHMAVMRKQVKIVEELLKFGADANDQNNSGSSPLHISAVIESDEISKMLLNYRATIDLKNYTGESALHIAVKHNHYNDNKLDNVEALLKAGANPDAVDVLGNTPLHVSAVNYSSQYVEILLRYDATVNIKNKEGKSPLHIASMEASYKTVALLVEKGADLDMLCNDGMRAIDYAFSLPRDAPYDYGPSGDYEEGMEYNIWVNRDNGNLAADETYKVFKQHDDMLKLLHNSSTDSIASSLFKRSEFGKACYEELHKLKTMKIGNTSMTYYEFCKKDGQKLLNLIKNEKIRCVLGSNCYKEDFEHFSSLIGNKFCKGLCRQKLIDKFRAKSDVIFQALPFECVEIILDYLCNDDIANIVACSLGY